MSEGFPGTGLGMALPRVSTNRLAGLMEILAGPPYNGKADLPEIAATLQMQVDDLFPVVETLQLLRFADTADGDMHLTEQGRHFVEADVDARKRIFGDHLLAYVPIAGSDQTRSRRAAEPPRPLLTLQRTNCGFPSGPDCRRNDPHGDQLGPVCGDFCL